MEASLAKAARDLEALNVRERRTSARTQRPASRRSARFDAGRYGRAMRLALASRPLTSFRAA